MTITKKEIRSISWPEGDGRITSLAVKENTVYFSCDDGEKVGRIAYRICPDTVEHRAVFYEDGQEIWKQSGVGQLFHHDWISKDDINRIAKDEKKEFFNYVENQLKKISETLGEGIDKASNYSKKEDIFGWLEWLDDGSSEAKKIRTEIRKKEKVEEYTKDVDLERANVYYHGEVSRGRFLKSRNGQKKCLACNTIVDEGQTVCQNCGNEQTDITYSTRLKNGRKLEDHCFFVYYDRTENGRIRLTRIMADSWFDFESEEIKSEIGQKEAVWIVSSDKKRDVLWGRKSKRFFDAQEPFGIFAAIATKASLDNIRDVAKKDLSQSKLIENLNRHKELVYDLTEYMSTIIEVWQDKPYSYYALCADKVRFLNRSKVWYGSRYSYYIDSGETIEDFGVNRAQMKEFIAFDYSDISLNLLKVLKESGRKIGRKELICIKEIEDQYSSSELDDIRKIVALMKGIKKGNICKIVSYLEREDIKTDLYLDYLKGIEQEFGQISRNDCYLKKETVERLHQIQITRKIELDEIEARRRADEEKMGMGILIDSFRKSFPLLKSEYFSSEDGFFIFPPYSIHTLRKEGRFLKICIGNGYYYKKHLQGESVLLLLRKERMGNKPYVSIELDPIDKTVIQVKAKSNKLVSDPDTIQFLEKYFQEKGYNWEKDKPKNAA